MITYNNNNNIINNTKKTERVHKTLIFNFFNIAFPFIIIIIL